MFNAAIQSVYRASAILILKGTWLKPFSLTSKMTFLIENIWNVDTTDCIWKSNYNFHILETNKQNNDIATIVGYDLSVASFLVLGGQDPQMYRQT